MRTRPIALTTVRTTAEGSWQLRRTGCNQRGSPRSGGPSYTLRASSRPPGVKPVEACVPLVRLRSVVCLLDRFPALAGVDLDVEAGEIVLLSGANGSGKTTLLRLLAGLHRLHGGTAEVLGHDLSVDRRGARRAIGLLGHETGCYDDLTVHENLRFAARAAGSDVAASDAVLERVGLTAQGDVAHGRLSAGQRRRLPLALALARHPTLPLLDEPDRDLGAVCRP